MARQRGPRPRPGVLDIAPYVPGTSALPGARPVIKLSSNETPFGPTPRAIEAYLAAAAAPVALPRRLGARLARSDRQALRARSGRIVCGAGSDELLNLLAAAYLGPGDEAIYSAHGFLVYKIAILAHGATPVVAPETDLTADVDAILACVTPAHARGVHRQSEQPDRHLSPLRRGEAPARGLARRRAARARRGLRRICAQERLRGRHRAGRHHARTR